VRPGEAGEDPDPQHRVDIPERVGGLPQQLHLTLVDDPGPPAGLLHPDGRLGELTAIAALACDRGGGAIAADRLQPAARSAAPNASWIWPSSAGSTPSSTAVW